TRPSPAPSTPSRSRASKTPSPAGSSRASRTTPPPGPRPPAGRAPRAPPIRRPRPPLDLDERSCFYARMSKGTATRQAVLDEAARAASRVGLGGLTIGLLAPAPQLSKGGLFPHFQSKEPLQLQLLEHARARFIEQVVRPALAAPRGGPRVGGPVRRWPG